MKKKSVKVGIVALTTSLMLTGTVLPPSTAYGAEATDKTDVKTEWTDKDYEREYALRWFV